MSLGSPSAGLSSVRQELERVTARLHSSQACQSHLKAELARLRERSDLSPHYSVGLGLTLNYGLCVWFKVHTYLLCVSMDSERRPRGEPSRTAEEWKQLEEAHRHVQAEAKKVSDGRHLDQNQLLLGEGL